MKIGVQDDDGKRTKNIGTNAYSEIAWIKFSKFQLRLQIIPSTKQHSFSVFKN